MKVYVLAFEGVFPVGATAVVTAKNKVRAAELMNNHLKRHDEFPNQTIEPDDMIHVKTNREHVFVLDDGNY